MASIKCSKCGREVSGQASACPGCGARISIVPDIVTRPVRGTRTSRKWAVAGIILIIIGIVIGVAGNSARGWAAAVAGFVVFLIGRSK
jgi:hypothetical protein